MRDAFFHAELAEAREGNVEAQHNLGVRSATGEGLPQNDAEAVSLWRKAGTQGYALAQFNLGLMYSKGDGVRKNYVKAYSWLSVANSRVMKLAARILIFSEEE